MFSEESVGDNLVIDVEYSDDDVFPDAVDAPRTTSSTPVAMNNDSANDVKSASPESRQKSVLVHVLTSDRCSPITENLPTTYEQSSVAKTSVADKSPEVTASCDVSVGEAWSWAVQSPTETLTNSLTHPVCKFDGKNKRGVNNFEKGVHL